MRKVLGSCLVGFFISFTLTVPSVALEVNTSPAANSMSSHGAVSTLSVKQKLVVQEARKKLGTSIAMAKSAYSLLVADAKANRDQLILTANKDVSAIASARARFSHDLAVAKAVLNDAIMQSNKIYAESLAIAGVSPSK